MNAIPILCAGCNATIQFSPAHLDKKMACPSCKEPIHVDDYEPLVRERDRIREEKRAAKEAENERQRQEAEERRRAEIAHRERERERKRIEEVAETQYRDRVNKQLAATEKQRVEDDGGWTAFIVTIIAWLCMIVCILIVVTAALKASRRIEPSLLETELDHIKCTAYFVAGIFAFVAVAVLRYLAKIRMEVRNLRNAIQKD